MAICKRKPWTLANESIVVKDEGIKLTEKLRRKAVFLIKTTAFRLPPCVSLIRKPCPSCVVGISPCPPYVNNSKNKNSGVNEHGPGSQLSVQIAMGLPGEWIRRDHVSSFSQLPGFQPFLPVIHTCIGPPISLSHSSHHIWWVFWIIRNETIERTPKSLQPACEPSLGNQYLPQGPVDKPSCEPRIRGRRDISRIWAPHAALLELPVLFSITRPFWWQTLWEEKDSQFRWPVCVFGGGSWEEGGMQKREGCAPHGFRGSPRASVAARWVRTRAGGAVFTDFSSQLCLWLAVSPRASYLTSLCLIHEIVYPHLRVVRLQWVNMCKTLKILPACPPHREQCLTVNAVYNN